MTDHDKIVDKVRKLKAHAESAQAIGNEAEAQAFAAAFQRMLTSHRLEMSDLEFTSFEREQPVEKHWVDYTNYPGIEFKRRRCSWMEDLADVIARAHFCRILVSHGNNSVTFVGKKEDAAVVEYMFVTLVRAIQKMADDAYAKYSLECVAECEGCGEHRSKHRRASGSTLYCTDGGMFEPNWAKCRGFRPSFIESFIRRLTTRYREERERLASTSTALVRLKNSDAAVIQFLNQKLDNGKPAIGKAKSLSTTVISNRAGYMQGTAAANKINLRADVLNAGNGEEKKRLT